VEMEALLVSADQYAASSIGVLERYVEEQVRGEKAYDFVANKALLKLYQLHTPRHEARVLALIFGLALAARPATDLKTLLYACPEKLLEANAEAKKIVACDALLDASKFDEFWNQVDTTLIPSLAPAIRTFLVGLTAATFQSVSLDFFGRVLGLNATEADEFLRDHAQLASKTADGVTFATNLENQPRSASGLGKSVGLPALLGLFDGVETASNADASSFVAAAE